MSRNIVGDKNLRMKLSAFIVLTVLSTVANCEDMNLTCKYHTTGGTYNEVALTFYSCMVPATFIVSQPKVKILSVNDDTNKHLVRAIQVNDGTMKYMPTNFGDFFQNPFYISIMNSKLLEVRRENLEKFEKLRIIYLCNNQLEFLERDLFAKNKFLEYIYLNDNNLKYVSSGTFDGLFYLEFLSMQNVGCVDSQVRFRNAVLELAKTAAKQCRNKNVIDDLVKRDQAEFLETCDDEVLKRVCHLDSDGKREMLFQMFEDQCQRYGNQRNF